MSVNMQLVQSIQSCVYPKYKSVTVALSGGIDSVVMLHACLQLRAQTSTDSFKLSAVHVHHGLSPNADAWLAFCQDLCDKHQIEFQFQKVNLNKQPRQSLEELARNARYAVIDDLASPESLVLLAQHEDDQAETLLLQLKRGAGPKGLSGMAKHFSKSSDLTYARPWIDAGIGKQDILAYAQQHHLTWVEDESNEDHAFERNFIRNEVLPILKNKWPQITKTISRSAQLCAAQNELVESFAEQALQKIISDAGALSIAGLQVLPDLLAAEVLRMWTAKQSKLTVSIAQLNEIRKLSQAKADQVGFIQLKSWQCRRFNQYLYWVDDKQVVIEPYEPFNINIEALKTSEIRRENVSVSLLSSAGFTEKTHQILTTASEIQDIEVIYGDLQRKVKMYESRPSKTIKAWMKEWKIEPWRRMAIPILMIGNEVLAIVTDEAVNIRDANKVGEGDLNSLKLAFILR